MTPKRVIPAVLPALLTAFLLASPTAHAKDPHAEAGFSHFYNLEYDEAIAEFRLETKLMPGQPDGFNHLAQAILYREMFKSGILENSLVSGDDILLSLIHQPRLKLSPADEQEFQRSIASVVNSARARLTANPGDAGALYALGVAYGLRANYDFLVRKAWLAAIRNGNEARRLHRKARQLDPSNADALLVQGVHDYVLASLPAGLRILGAVAGMRGDKEAGLRTLQEVATRGDQNRVEAEIFLAVLYRHEKRTGPAISILDELMTSFPRNYLLHLAQIYTYIEGGDGMLALASLRSLEDRTASGAPGYGRVQSARIQSARGLIQSRFAAITFNAETTGRISQSSEKLAQNSGASYYGDTDRATPPLATHGANLHNEGNGPAFHSVRL